MLDIYYYYITKMIILYINILGIAAVFTDIFFFFGGGVIFIGY